MSHRHKVHTSIMFTNVERPYSAEFSPYCPHQPAHSYAVAARKPSCLSGLLTTGIVTGNEYEALHYQSLHPLPCCKVWQKPLSDKIKHLRLLYQG